MSCQEGVRFLLPHIVLGDISNGDPTVQKFDFAMVIGAFVLMGALGSARLSGIASRFVSRVE